MIHCVYAGERAKNGLNIVYSGDDDRTIVELFLKIPLLKTWPQKYEDFDTMKLYWGGMRHYIGVYFRIRNPKAFMGKVKRVILDFRHNKCPCGDRYFLCDMRMVLMEQ